MLWSGPIAATRRVDDGGAAGERTPAEMRAALRRRAATARGHARELVAECARLDARYRMKRVRHEPLLASRAELRAPLAESIIGYARERRDLGAQPLLRASNRESHLSHARRAR